MRAVLSFLAIAALVSATALPKAKTVAPGRLMRDLVRPLVLPGLWSKLRELPVNNDPGESLAVLRMVSDLLPEWTDGIIDVAWREAVEWGGEARDPDQAAARTLHAERWLTSGANERRADQPAAAAELLLAAATILTVFQDAHPQAAIAYRARQGAEPIARAEELTEAALSVVDDPSVSLRLAHTAVRVVASALRTDDVHRAQSVLDAARDRFASLSDHDSARRALIALSRLPPLAELVADPDRARVFLGDPDLDEIARAILNPERG